MQARRDCMRKSTSRKGAGTSAILIFACNRDELASRLHAEIYCEEGRWHIRDFDFRMQSRCKLVAQNDCVVPAATECNRLTGREIKRLGQAVTGFQGDTCTHIPTGSKQTRS